MTDDNEDSIHRRLGEALRPTLALHEQLAALRDVALPPDSPAMVDSNAVPFGQLVRSHAMTAATNGVDHLVAWGALYIQGRWAPTFAHMTLLRGSLEGCSTARWLVDPAVDSRVRIARGVGAQLADLAERAKIENLPRKTPPAPRQPNFRPASERIHRLEEAAAAAGICPLRIGHTDVVARFGPGEASYRLVCSYAHAGMALTMATSDLEVADENDPDGLRVARLTANPQLSLDMTELAIANASRAVREIYAYVGHRLDQPTPGD